ncbi:B1 protein-like [Rhynchophorus ferrugineus]|uniref:Uncharacterized protein n=1 Tax=Rhynchophorus ferrugineus TaxID=354439 RepID=A0A834M6J2_RHYFE|nr:hypothetical protein GWI33_014825 [Rhynchophorus ferrugineus]
MKQFLLIITVIGISSTVFAELSEAQKQKVDSYENECMVKTGVARDVVEKAQQGTLIDDPKLKAFAFCISKKIGLQNEKGEVQIEALKEQLPSLVENPEQDKDLIASCLGDSKDPEEIAFHTYICYYKANPN